MKLNIRVFDDNSEYIYTQKVHMKDACVSQTKGIDLEDKYTLDFLNFKDLKKLKAAIDILILKKEVINE
ncbi:MAG TPA: hypothetical protein VNU45_00305 [Rummeliibacillus sp.]|nr:hypothetical protein [Rummeliibacillus sp.]